MPIIICLLLVSAALAQEIVCEAVERLYPLELLDLAAWRSACRQAASDEAALAALDDPLAELAYGSPVSSTVDYYHLEGSTVGMIHLSGFAGGTELVDAFDAALEQARYEDGLILDLRGAQGGDVATAYAIMGRLTLANLPGVRVLRRDHTATTDVPYSIAPRGPWQFDLPVVILTDEGTGWPAEALLLASRRRSQIESVGRPTQGTRGVEPVPVSLEDERVAMIPTAAVRTPEGKLLRGQPLEPGVNVDDEQAFLDYRSYPDPALQRGLDELYRMIGRLDWLQDEYRRELLRQDSLRRRPK